MSTSLNHVKILPFCSYCRANGHPFIGHFKFDCPKLKVLAPCIYCGAKGVNNHTAR